MDFRSAFADPADQSDLEIGGCPQFAPETLMTHQGHVAALAVDAGLDTMLLNRRVFGRSD